MEALATGILTSLNHATCLSFLRIPSRPIMYINNFRSIVLLASGSHTLVHAGAFDLPIIFDNSYVGNVESRDFKIFLLIIGKQASVEVQIGTPAETYRLHFDTGSASTWVANERCAVACANGSGYARVAEKLLSK